MAMTLYITDSAGTYTATLYNAPSAYVLADGEYGSNGYAPEPGNDRDELVTESADVNTIGASGMSDGKTLVQTANRLFEMARYRARTMTGPRVFVYFKNDSGDSLNRSEIVDGRVIPDKETSGLNAARNEFIGRFQWTRRPWWEGPEAQLGITNQSATNNTSGLTINNHTVSGSTSAYFTVAAGAISGDLPSACRIELTNSTSATTLTYCLVGMFQNTSSWTTGGFIQGESASFGGSTTGSASASGSNYQALTVSTSETFGAMTWSIGGSTIAITDGKPILPLMRFHALPPAVVYLKLGVVGTSVDYTATDTTKQWMLFPPMALPPQRSGGPYQAHTLTMDTKNSTGSSQALQVDYVALIPADNVRQFVNLNMANADILVDDAIEGYSYVSSSGNRITQHVAIGEPFMLWPGLAHTFWVLFSSSSNNMLPANTMSAKLYYRPRRSTI